MCSATEIYGEEILDGCLNIHWASELSVHPSGMPSIGCWNREYLIVSESSLSYPILEVIHLKVLGQTLLWTIYILIGSHRVDVFYAPSRSCPLCPSRKFLFIYCIYISSRVCHLSLIWKCVAFFSICLGACYLLDKKASK